MIKFSYATSGFADRNLESALDIISAVGFKYVEILGQKPHLDSPLTGQALQQFRMQLRSRGLNASVHAPLTTNVLGAPEKQWRREKVKVLEAYLRFSGEIEAEEMVVHPVPNPVFVPNSDSPELSKKIGDAVRRSLDDLIRVSESTGVRILLENLPYKCNYPFLEMKQLRKLVDSYPSDAVGLLVDTGHAVVRGLDPASEIRIAGDRLHGVHLHDSDGIEDRHWLPGEGIIDWDETCRSLVEVNYNGPWIFELDSENRAETPEELCQHTLTIANRWQILFG